jgi:predicted nuclease of predicted toxin-antitoxin system
MKVLCDVHLSYRLVNRLRQRGVDAVHVNRILDGYATKDAAVELGSEGVIAFGDRA